MPKNNPPVKLIQSVARDMGIKISSRVAAKASMLLDRIEDAAEQLHEIEAFLRLYSDPTGERAVRNVINGAKA